MHNIIEIKVGTWVKYLDEDAYGQIIDIPDKYSATINWLDIGQTTNESLVRLMRPNSGFEVLGILSEQEELFLKLKYAR